ncbi:acyl-CoA dehydrogenase FadE9 [Salinibacterium xinjiangense]|uniref:Acyl-CoA dehydrogenase n=1 Tax=Salinibacterium xinjiangense TaxID=386302 RepID=A0A2C8Z5A4_9MICO|nr:acyl-CoA dehydrogenase family protein [Salinibacterium xinjiangense]GGK93164.1 acyl-CoA dehydrogenase FadE9 [Salinibacterium xinjiangense]SOE58968.1 Acyl-CoA dehydrogenase [Salinibacterium xinjiangense]
MYPVTEDQASLVEMVAQFAAESLAPYAAEWDETHYFPVEVLREAGALGMGGIYTREEFGGSGLSRADSVLIFEALAAGDTTIAAYLSIHNMVTWMVDTYGSLEQRAEWVPRLASMDALGSYCLTEPGVGSDAGALSTQAVRDGDDYVLNGVKQFISGAGAAGLYIVMARTADTGSHGISAFLVADGTPGLSFGPLEKKMGWRAQPTRQVILDDIRMPASAMLAGEGEGFGIAMSGLDSGRLNIGACSVGGGQAALDKSVAYLKQREAFGSPLIQNQALLFQLADMDTELETARTLLARAALAVDNDDADKVKLCAMAKRVATDAGFAVANAAIQLHGGYGYLSEYGLERIVRDLRVHQILEGTNEIMRMIVGRSLADR